MVKDFVSVSGVTNKEELAEIARICRSEKIDFPVVIGYQVSHKTVNGEPPNARQPAFSDLPELSRATHFAGLIQAFHYFTKDHATIIPDLERIVATGCLTTGPVLLQCNTLPSGREVLTHIQKRGFETIFKVAVANKKEGGYAVWKGEGVEDVASGNVDALVRQIDDVSDLVSYAMFAPSHGTGLGLALGEHDLAIRFGKAIRERNELDNIGLVYAGGIGPENVARTRRMLSRYFPAGFSIDTETGVRDVTKNGKEIISDTLNMEKVKEFLVNYRDAYASNSQHG